MQITAKHKLVRQIRRRSAATMSAIAVSAGLYFGLSLGQSFASALQQPDPALAVIIDGPQRSNANKARLKDQDREKYSAIGESDRFVLKFAKPAEAK